MAGKRGKAGGAGTSGTRSSAAAHPAGDPAGGGAVPDAAGGAPPALPGPPEITIRVVNGLIEDIPEPDPDLPIDALAVGHYLGVAPVRTEGRWTTRSARS